jgi:hypothetical protein
MIIRKVMQIVISGICGAITGTFLTVPYFYVLNTLAEDGPYFSPIMVAPLIVGPITLIFIPIQFVALISQNWTGWRNWRISFLAVITGSILCLFFFSFVFSMHLNYKNSFPLAFITILQGISIFASLSFLRSIK